MMAIPTKWEIFKEFVGNLIAGAVFFGILLLLSWCLGQAIDKQSQIDEAQRAEVVRL
jgi:hypothetical protein